MLTIGITLLVALRHNKLSSKSLAGLLQAVGAWFYAGSKRLG